MKYKGHEIEQRGPEWVIVYERAPAGERGDVVESFPTIDALTKEVRRRIREQRTQERRELERALGVKLRKR